MNPILSTTNDQIAQSMNSAGAQVETQNSTINISKPETCKFVSQLINKTNININNAKDTLFPMDVFGVRRPITPFEFAAVSNLAVYKTLIIGSRFLGLATSTSDVDVMIADSLYHNIRDTLDHHGIEYSIEEAQFLLPDICLKLRLTTSDSETPVALQFIPDEAFDVLADAYLKRVYSFSKKDLVLAKARLSKQDFYKVFYGIPLTHEALDIVRRDDRLFSTRTFYLADGFSVFDHNYPRELDHDPEYNTMCRKLPHDVDGNPRLIMPIVRALRFGGPLNGNSPLENQYVREAFSTIKDRTHFIMRTGHSTRDGVFTSGNKGSYGSNKGTNESTDQHNVETAIEKAIRLMDEANGDASVVHAAMGVRPPIQMGPLATEAARANAVNTLRRREVMGRRFSSDEGGDGPPVPSEPAPSVSEEVGEIVTEEAPVIDSFEKGDVAPEIVEVMEDLVSAVEEKEGESSAPKHEYGAASAIPDAVSGILQMFYDKAISGNVETHLGGSNFIGQNTLVNGRVSGNVGPDVWVQGEDPGKPTHEADWGAYFHDFAFEKMKGLDEDGMEEAIKFTNDEFVKDMDVIIGSPDATAKDVAIAKFARTMMSMLSAGQNVGIFSRAGFHGMTPHIGDRPFNPSEFAEEYHRLHPITEAKGYSPSTLAWNKSVDTEAIEAEEVVEAPNIPQKEEITTDFLDKNDIELVRYHSLMDLLNSRDREVQNSARLALGCNCLLEPDRYRENILDAAKARIIIEIGRMGPTDSRYAQLSDKLQKRSYGGTATNPDTSVFVKGLDGRTMTVGANRDGPIGDVFAEVSRKTGMPVDEIKLTWGGKYLQHDKTLRDYNIFNNSNIEQVAGLVGGGDDDNVQAEMYNAISAAAPTVTIDKSAALDYVVREFIENEDIGKCAAVSWHDLACRTSTITQNGGAVPKLVPIGTITEVGNAAAGGANTESVTQTAYNAPTHLLPLQNWSTEVISPLPPVGQKQYDTVLRDIGGLMYNLTVTYGNTILNKVERGPLMTWISDALSGANRLKDLSDLTKNNPEGILDNSLAPLINTVFQEYVTEDGTQQSNSTVLKGIKLALNLADIAPNDLGNMDQFCANTWRVNPNHDGDKLPDFSCLRAKSEANLNAAGVAVPGAAGAPRQARYFPFSKSSVPAIDGGGADKYDFPPARGGTATQEEADGFVGALATLKEVLHELALGNPGTDRKNAVNPWKPGFTPDCWGTSCAFYCYKGSDFPGPMSTQALLTDLLSECAYPFMGTHHHYDVTDSLGHLDWQVKNTDIDVKQKFYTLANRCAIDGPTKCVLFIDVDDKAPKGPGRSLSLSTRAVAGVGGAAVVTTYSHDVFSARTYRTPIDPANPVATGDIPIHLYFNHWIAPLSGLERFDAAVYAWNLWKSNYGNENDYKCIDNFISNIYGTMPTPARRCCGGTAGVTGDATKPRGQLFGAQYALCVGSYERDYAIPAYLSDVSEPKNLRGINYLGGLASTASTTAAWSNNAVRQSSLITTFASCTTALGSRINNPGNLNPPLLNGGYAKDLRNFSDRPTGDTVAGFSHVLKLGLISGFIQFPAAKRLTAATLAKSACSEILGWMHKNAALTAGFDSYTARTGFSEKLFIGGAEQAINPNPGGFRTDNKDQLRTQGIIRRVQSALEDRLYARCDTDCVSIKFGNRNLGRTNRSLNTRYLLTNITADRQMDMGQTSNWVDPTQQVFVRTHPAVQAYYTGASTEGAGLLPEDDFFNIGEALSSRNSDLYSFSSAAGVAPNRYLDVAEFNEGDCTMSAIKNNAAKLKSYFSLTSRGSFTSRFGMVLQTATALETAEFIRQVAIFPMLTGIPGHVSSMRPVMIPIQLGTNSGAYIIQSKAINGLDSRSNVISANIDYADVPYPIVPCYDNMEDNRNRVLIVPDSKIRAVLFGTGKLGSMTLFKPVTNFATSDYKHDAIDGPLQRAAAAALAGGWGD